ncbi:hypothetical protein GLAREA_13071 [Glarea lozoyensis ATCC 20868]|uniref:Heterokaryon incompatibility domain-containing protein n=1 Tax=Glarea lozoyensis (strain ATCC 20868 / MF5171) TaxID=1116229 RepID=S3DUB8_GLAL2|nr:uncharacterized protein GLAREA_13071 [Glarea lozoyensis ATCC 20868]EPE30023.1 hypothetical protein GLAREA_13071 [Glarea lozoyensis ATCC 20868]
MSLQHSVASSQRSFNRDPQESWTKIRHIKDQEFVVTSKANESPLCSICRNMLRLLDGNIHVTCDIRVETRAQAGCYLCALFAFRLKDSRYVIKGYRKDQQGPRFTLRYITDFFRFHNLPIHLVQSEEEQVAYGNNPSCWNVLTTSVLGVDYKGATSHNLLDSFDLLTVTGHISDIIAQPDILSLKNKMEIASVWMQQCKARHTSCALVDPHIIPTRVVDVSLQTPPAPLLCLGQAIPTGAKYATLSHCWGDPNTMSVKLQRSTLPLMLQGIDFNSLPKTFQDAINVTQSLGIRYLWIDSLCIIQDSIEDWRHESALMSQVYSNGVVNICATAGSDSTKGLLFGRVADVTWNVHVQLPKNQFPETAIFCDPQIWRDGVDNAVLNRRAWVLQERLLSRRNLCFGEEQLFWECCEKSACEMFPDAIQEQLLGANDMPSLKIFSSVIIQDAPKLPELRSIWNKLVRYYTNCLLSHRLDKLVAIGGIVSRLQNMYGGQYMAGLWRDRMAYQLCWLRDNQDEDENMRLPDNPCELVYVAPSWSWASCNYQVVNFKASLWEDYYFPVVEVVDVHVELVSENPYGEIKGGFLTLKGRLARAEYNEEGVRLYQTPKLASFKGPTWDPDIVFTWDSPGTRETLDEKATFYMLPILGHRVPLLGHKVPILEHRDAFNDLYDILGIVIRPISGHMPLRFKRLAGFRAYGLSAPAAAVVWCDYFDKTYEDCGLDLEPSTSATGITQYTITII